MSEEDRIRREVARWRAAPRQRPEGLAPPGPGQESVWDYPRPPRLERSRRHVLVRHAGEILAETRRAFRVCETAGAPTWYVPPEDVVSDRLEPATGRSLCEWKGQARYWRLLDAPPDAAAVAWSYPAPFAPFSALRDHLAFFAGRLDTCRVDGEDAVPQPGGFYGGWITPDVVGPFKGGPGSEGW